MKLTKHFRCTTAHFHQLTKNKVYSTTTYSDTVVQVTADNNTLISFNRVSFQEVALEDFVYVGSHDRDSVVPQAVFPGLTLDKTYEGYRYVDESEFSGERVCIVNDHGDTATYQLLRFKPVVPEPEPLEVLRAKLVSAQSVVEEIMEQIEIASRSPYTLEHLEPRRLYSTDVTTAAREFERVLGLDDGGSFGPRITGSLQGKGLYLSGEYVWSIEVDDHDAQILVIKNK